MSHERFRSALITVAFVASATAVAFLPGALPRDFGVPRGWDAWPSRIFSAFFLPLAAALVCVLFGRLTTSDPLRANYDRFRSTYNLALNAAVVFILGLHAVLLATLLLGVRPWIGYLPPLLAGVLVIVVGNALPRVRPNAVLGVPTAWARGSERAWIATHRAGGYILVSFGVFLIGAPFLMGPPLGWVAGAGAAVVVMLLVLVSYAVSRVGRDRTAH